MTIKIVHGVVSDVSLTSSSSPNQNPNPAAARSGQNGQSVGVARAAVQSEAVVTAVRSHQGSEAGRVRDHKEAKSVAREVADRIRYEGEGVDAHGRLPYMVDAHGQLAD